MNKKIIIKTNEKKYDIEINYNFINKKLKRLIENKNILFIIIDISVIYLLKNINFPKNVIVIKIKGSEKIKNFNNYEKITKKILISKVNRNSTIVAIGGGTVGDLGGFIASTVLRGINFILIPTTLLSQVDSSIGGKNGINTNFGKNLIGTFYQPDKVLIDTKLLESLNKRELKSGYAEIVKHSIINDIVFFKWLDKNYNKIFNLEKNALMYSIYKSIKIKSKYVSRDTKEILTNINSRAILNFGHTFGHALETYYKYKKLTHGEAISIGMTISSKVSQRISSLSKNDLEKIINHFHKVGLPTNDKNISNKRILDIIQRDKKNINNKMNLILLKKIGKAYYSRNLDPEYIFNILK